MTGYYGHNSPKLKSENICITPTKSPVGNHSSMIRKYLRSDNDENQFSSPKLSRPIRNASRSPLSAVENIQISPLKVEDDVVVMDAFTISASKRNAGGGGRIRSSVNSDSSGKSSTGSNSVSYSGSGRNSGGGHKMEKCHVWEKSGKCRYGSQCQYTHGQEELRPLGSRLNNRNSLEPIIRQPYLSPRSSNNSPINTFAVGNIRSASTVNAKATSNLYRASQSSLPSPSASPNHSTVSVLTSPYHSAASVLPSPSPSPNHSVFSARPSPNHSAVSVLTSPYHSAVSVLPSPSPSPSPSPNHSMVSALPSPNHSTIPALASPKGLNTDWSPVDDAINASDPMSREDADDYIHKVLYGPIRSKRLPVFVDICPDCNGLAHLSLQSKV